MTTRTMTIKEIKRELSQAGPQDKMRERAVMQREPDLTDPDAPPVSADMIPFASRPGRTNPTMKKVLTPIRLDYDVARALKSTGRNWTTRANSLLRHSLHIQGLI